MYEAWVLTLRKFVRWYFAFIITIIVQDWDIWSAKLGVELEWHIPGKALTFVLFIFKNFFFLMYEKSFCCTVFSSFNHNNGDDVDDN